MASVVASHSSSFCSFLSFSPHRNIEPAYRQAGTIVKHIELCESLCSYVLCGSWSNLKFFCCFLLMCRKNNILPPVMASKFSFPHQIPAVSYTHLRAHETPEHLVCRLLLEKK